MLVEKARVYVMGKGDKRHVTVVDPEGIALTTTLPLENYMTDERNHGVFDLRYGDFVVLSATESAGQHLAALGLSGELPTGAHATVVATSRLEVLRGRPVPLDDLSIVLRSGTFPYAHIRDCVARYKDHVANAISLARERGGNPDLKGRTLATVVDEHLFGH